MKRVIAYRCLDCNIDTRSPSFHLLDKHFGEDGVPNYVHVFEDGTTDESGEDK